MNPTRESSRTIWWRSMSRTSDAVATTKTVSSIRSLVLSQLLRLIFSRKSWTTTLFASTGRFKWQCQLSLLLHNTKSRSRANSTDLISTRVLLTTLPKQDTGTLAFFEWFWRIRAAMSFITGSKKTLRSRPKRLASKKSMNSWGSWTLFNFPHFMRKSSHR